MFYHSPSLVDNDKKGIELDSIIVENSYHGHKRGSWQLTEGKHPGSQGMYAFDGLFSTLLTPSVLDDTEVVVEEEEEDDEKGSFGYVSSSSDCGEDNASDTSTRKDHYSNYDLKAISSFTIGDGSSGRGSAGAGLFQRQDTDPQYGHSRINSSSTANNNYHKPFPVRAASTSTTVPTLGDVISSISTSLRTKAKRGSPNSQSTGNRVGSSRSFPSISLTYSQDETDDHSSIASRPIDPLVYNTNMGLDNQEPRNEQPKHHFYDETISRHPAKHTPITSKHNSLRWSSSSLVKTLEYQHKYQQTDFFQWTKSMLNLMYRLKDGRLRSKFLNFNRDHDSSSVLIILCGCLVFVDMLMLGVIARDSHDMHDQMSNATLALSIVMFLLSLVIQCTVMLLLLKKNKQKIPILLQNAKAHFHRSHLIHFLAVMVQTLVIIFTVRRSVGDKLCSSSTALDTGFSQVINYFYCGNSDYSTISDQIPMDAVVILSLSPICIAASFPSIDILWHWIQVMSSFATLVITTAITVKKMPSILLLVVMVCCNVYLIVHFQSQQLQLFYWKLQQRNSFANVIQTCLQQQTTRARSPAEPEETIGTTSATISNSYSYSGSNHNLSGGTLATVIDANRLSKREYEHGLVPEATLQSPIAANTTSPTLSPSKPSQYHSDQYKDISILPSTSFASSSSSMKSISIPRNASNIPYTGQSHAAHLLPQPHSSPPSILSNQSSSRIPPHKVNRSSLEDEQEEAYHSEASVSSMSQSSSRYNRHMQRFIYACADDDHMVMDDEKEDAVDDENYHIV